MDECFRKALGSGYERIVAWADLLDDINVFPVADADTGRNLTMSLVPMRETALNCSQLAERLLMSAIGNSGNIAAAFFIEFVAANSLSEMASVATSGRAKAWHSVADPKGGTMLTVFDALSEALANGLLPTLGRDVSDVIEALAQAVDSTSETLPELRKAGVVDAGALGMFIFFEGFFGSLSSKPLEFRPFIERFEDKLSFSVSPKQPLTGQSCITGRIVPDGPTSRAATKVACLGDSVVTVTDDRSLKIHLHTDDCGAVRTELERLGKVVSWAESRIVSSSGMVSGKENRGSVHIMTDAAGSFTREDARSYGVTLLDSYLVIDGRSLPESHFVPKTLYDQMRQGVRVSTAQASVSERHQCYESALSRFENVVYLSVGSVYTGNYATACDWKAEHDRKGRFHVIDTGAASGRLGLLTIATARYTKERRELEKVVAFANAAVAECRELIFLDGLKYLGMSGRISKASGFFGDLVRAKPIISPTAEGVKRIGLVRKKSGQLPFALNYLENALVLGSAPVFMLEFSDNESWVGGTVKPAIEALFPMAEVFLQPLSLTSGAHMGPGTWGIAFLPERLD